jgi:hypothetical protein
MMNLDIFADSAVELYAAGCLVTLFILIRIWRHEHFGTLEGIEQEMRAIIILSCFWSFVFSTWFFNWCFTLPVFTWRFWLREIPTLRGEPLSGWWQRR